MESLDCLAELRGEEHAGSLSSSTRWDAAEGKVNVSFKLSTERLTGCVLSAQAVVFGHHRCSVHCGQIIIGSS